MMQDDSGAFSQAGDGRALLRILSGAQAGAEIVLQERTYIVGSGEDCDVYLAEPTLAGAHLALTIDATVSIAAVDSAVAINDRLIQPGESVEVSLPLILDLGAATLGLGDRVTDWRSLPVPDLQALQSAAAAAEAEKTAEAAEDAAAAVSDGEELGNQDPEAAAEATLETAAQGAAQVERSVHARLRLLVGIACLVTAGVVAYDKQGRLMSILGPSGSTEAGATSAAVSAPAVVERREQIADALRAAGLSEVHVEVDGDDGLVLLGFVPDDAARTALRALAPAPRDETRNVAAMMQALELALSGFRWPEADFGNHLEARYAGNGTFVLDGYLGPEVDRTSLRRRLMGDVPGMVAIDFQRASLAAWQEILTERLSEARLAQWISVTPQLGRLNVTGEVTEREADRWRAVGEAFVAESRGWPRIIINVRAATPAVLGETAEPAAASDENARPEGPVSAVVQPAVRPDFHVIGVIIPTDGGPGRVLLDDGETAAEGSTLQNGALVRAITPTRVVIEIGDQTFEYRMKEPR